MAKHTFDYDLVVIGSGAGGSAAAAIAARNGKRVALVESDTFGGESPNWGDVPTKSLLHAASIYDAAKNAQQFGIRAGALSYNYPSIKAWKDLAVSRTGTNGNKRYYEAQGISVYEGSAHFLNPHELSVNRRHITGANILVATGSNWEVPSIPGLDKINYITPREATDLIRPPKSLFIIGAGATGMEFAQLFSIFGTKVHIADVAPRLLPAEDEEVGELVERLMREQKGITALTSTRIVKVAKEALSTRVTYSRGNTEHSVKVDTVLVATGKVPSVDIGLENAGVEYTPKGIDVNDHLQTTAKHIYAAGDVLGEYMYTHVALYESRVAVQNMFNRDKVVPNYTAVPRVTYVTPEVASVGLSEDDCIKRDMDVQKVTAPINIIGRSNIANMRDGFVKIIADKKGMIIGATVVSPEAGEVIHELALAIRYNLSARQVSETLHAFPTWSEAVRVATGKVA